jgi:hypothetical protein
VVYRRNEASPVVTAFLKALRQKFPKASRLK